MKILVLSDLHLAHLSFPAVHAGERIDAQADVVVLAGDIDDGVGGFRWARETFPDKPIVYVAGNHEFYGYNWKEIQDRVNQTNGDRPGFVGENLSRQRMNQYTQKGIDFLLDRGVFVPKPEAREADLAPQKPKQKHRQSKPTR